MDKVVDAVIYRRKPCKTNLLREWVVNLRVYCTRRSEGNFAPRALTMYAKRGGRKTLRQRCAESNITSVSAREQDDFGKRLPWSISQSEMAIENHEILNSSTLAVGPVRLCAGIAKTPEYKCPFLL